MSATIAPTDRSTRLSEITVRLSCRGFSAGGRLPPVLNLYRGASGSILIEQSGKVRRLSASGAFDAGYVPATMNIDGRSFAYTLMPQLDGRFVVVTGQQAPRETFQISVRFFLADGTPDTGRGDAFGERLLYPGGEGQYTDYPTSAATDENGSRILIAARWDRNVNDISLVLIRLNPDGTYDSTFDQDGVVLIGSRVGNVSSPKVTAGGDGPDRIPVRRALRPRGRSLLCRVCADGQRSAGCIGAVGRQDIGGDPPRDTRLNFDSLRWLSGSPELTVFGLAQSASPSGLSGRCCGAPISRPVP
ncbi:MAG: hypothetical protein IPI73_30320 [Betaproteobacteria bacterium]|nr:hypothetical protein [Betaproteobacteria bacterium]